MPLFEENSFVILRESVLLCDKKVSSNVVTNFLL